MQKNSSDQQSIDLVKINKDIVIDLFTLVYNEGLWSKLSEITRIYGEDLYTQMTGDEFVEKNKEMKLTLHQHYNIIKEIISIPTSQTSFWKVVVKITWLMMLLENDSSILDSLDNEEYLRDIKRLLGDI